MTTQVRPGVPDLLRLLEGGSRGEAYHQADAARLTISDWLEREQPTDDADLRTGQDAFTRLLAAKDIRTRSDPYGAYFADPVEKFAQDAQGRALFPEWCARQWRRALGHPAAPLLAQERAQAIFLSSDYAINTAQKTYDDQTGLRQQQIQPAIPLTEVIARTTPIDGEDYRAMYLTEPAAADVRHVRVAEAAELPRAKITSSARTIRLHKFGRLLEMSYEAGRRLRIDQLGVFIQRAGVQTQRDQVTAAFDVAVNGDGNVGTAATSYNLTALDPATTANNLTAKAWLTFRMKFTNPYAMTAAFAREAPAVNLQLLTIGSANLLLATAGVPAGFARPFTPINQALADGIRLGVSDDAPANQIIGMDTRFAVEHVVERGSMISESERWIHRQVEILTMSENEAFAIYDQSATKVLNLAA